MPAAAIIAPIAIDAAATATTSALIGGIAASTFGVLGGAIVTGAVGGAAGGAIGAAVTGGDPGISALTGAISGGAGGGVGTELSGVSPLEQAAIKGATSFGTGTAASLIQGQNVGNALKSGAVSGIGSGIASGVGSELFGGDQTSTQTNPSAAQLERAQGKFGALPFFPSDTNQPPPSDFQSFSFNPNLPNPDLVNQPGSGTQSNNNQSSVLSGPAQSALSYGIQSGLSDLFGSNTPTSTSSGLALPSFNQSSGTATNANNPIGQGINALTQALTTVSDLGYSPGGPVFGSQSGSTPRKVWNQASLRVTDDTDNQ